MSAASDTKFRALATRLINQNGRTMTLVLQKSDCPEDPNKPYEPAPDRKRKVSVKAVAFPIDTKRIDGTVIQKGDINVFIAAADVGDIELSLKDELIDGNVTYRIEKFETIRPGDGKIMYELVVRR